MPDASNLPGRRAAATDAAGPRASQVVAATTIGDFGAGRELERWVRYAVVWCVAAWLATTAASLPIVWTTPLAGLAVAAAGVSLAMVARQVGALGTRPWTVLAAAVGTFGAGVVAVGGVLVGFGGPWQPPVEPPFGVVLGVLAILAGSLVHALWLSALGIDLARRTARARACGLLALGAAAATLLVLAGLLMTASTVVLVAWIALIGLLVPWLLAVERLVSAPVG